MKINVLNYVQVNIIQQYKIYVNRINLHNVVIYLKIHLFIAYKIVYNIILYHMTILHVYQLAINMF